MNEDEEIHEIGNEEPLVQNFMTTLVSTAPSYAREIALDQAVKLTLAGQVNADYALDFAEKFLAFLVPPESE